MQQTNHAFIVSLGWRDDHQHKEGFHWQSAESGMDGQQNADSSYW